MDPDFEGREISMWCRAFSVGEIVSVETGPRETEDLPMLRS
jgi:hypothetical protein